MSGINEGTNWVPTSWDLVWKETRPEMSDWDRMQERIKNDPDFKNRQDAINNVAKGMTVIVTAGVGAIAISSGAAALAASYLSEAYYGLQYKITDIALRSTNFYLFNADAINDLTFTTFSIIGSQLNLGPAG